MRADLTICLGMLIHESDAADYRDQVSRLWVSADRALVVSGFDLAPAAATPTRHFHEPLSATFPAVAPEAELLPGTRGRRDHDVRGSSTTACAPST